MPKKCGENSKAVAARARKEEAASTEKAKRAKEAEDALWADDDKHIAKKQARKEEAEKKRLEALEKKRERDALLACEAENERGKQTTSKKGPPPVPKVTRAQIQEELKKQESESSTKKSTPKNPETPIEENLNRTVLEGETAATIEEAISVLKLSDGTPEVDKHPEKRMKAAYEEFEKTRLPELKEEYPTFRLSQLKQLLRKEWMKHPNNPLNKQLAAMANR